MCTCVYAPFICLYNNFINGNFLHILMRKIYKKNFTIVFLTLGFVGKIFFSWRSAIGRPTEPLKESEILRFKHCK